MKLKRKTFLLFEGHLYSLYCDQYIFKRASVLYSTVQQFSVSKGIYFKVILLLFELIKNDNKDCCSLEFSVHQNILEKCIKVFTKINCFQH